jgi:hypothetical protein
MTVSFLMKERLWIIKLWKFEAFLEIKKTFSYRKSIQRFFLYTIWFDATAITLLVKWLTTSNSKKGWRN